MSTRACYIFKDEFGSYTVYIHGDGYPSWAWRYFRDTLSSGLTWKLPRFEADEFAAAFIAENKGASGGVRLMDKWNYVSDLEYLYTLTINNHVLIVKVEAVSAPRSGSMKPSRWKRETLFHGPLHRFIFAEGDCQATKSTGMRIDQINKILQEPTRSKEDDLELQVQALKEALDAWGKGS